MQFRVSNGIDRDFGMIPRAVWRAPLSTRAKICVAYLACLRDGACPYVAQIEADTGLGRDARRRAFSELEGAGIISWQCERDGAGRVVARTLAFDAMAVVALADAALPPENQADGSEALPPENPAGGNSGGERRVSVAGPTENQAVLRKEKERRARDAREARERARSPHEGGERAPAPSAEPTGGANGGGEVTAPAASVTDDDARAAAAALGRYAAGRLRDGLPVTANGSLIVPGTPHGDAVLAALDARDGQRTASGTGGAIAEREGASGHRRAPDHAAAQVATVAAALTAPSARHDRGGPRHE